MKPEPTRDELRADIVKLDEEERVEYMVEWFNSHYEDPVHSMPWDDGDYVWLVEECDASDELQDMFGGVVDDALIEEAVQAVEVECSRWVRCADLDEMDKEARDSMDK